MTGKRSGWLLWTAACAYVALVALEEQHGWRHFGYLPVPVLALALIWLDRLRPPHPLVEHAQLLRLLAVGTALFAAASAGPSDHPWLKATTGLGQLLGAAAALLSVSRLKEPAGLLRTPASAISLDALIVALVLWTLSIFLSLSRAIIPELVDVTPPTIDTAYLFSSLGTLLLLVAVLTRSRILRGLQLGVSDRTSAGLWLAVAGATIGAGSGFLQTATADRVAGITLIVTSSAVTYCSIDPSAARVARISRGTIALLLLGAPTTLLGAYFASKHPEQPVSVALGVAFTSLLVGVSAHRVSRPLGPAGSRWLDALTRSMIAALHPEPDLALRGALTALSKAEEGKEDRPELFRFDPPALISVDIAGYLTQRPAEFPEQLYDLASQEPGSTLRQATVKRAQVRRPDVRPLVAWFAAHGAKSVTALSDGEGPVGLLKMPLGTRKSPLTMEEVELLCDLSERLAGVVSVTSALARAHLRQQAAQEKADSEEMRVQQLQSQLEDQRESGRLDALMHAEPVHRTAHGPAARMALAELHKHAHQPLVTLRLPPGGTPLAWAACLHLERGAGAGPFIAIDCTSKAAHGDGFFDGSAENSPLARLRPSTLVLLGSSEPVRAQISQLAQRATAAGAFLVICEASSEAPQPGRPPSPPVATDAPCIDLPSLHSRAEDLTSWINFELSRIGLRERGRPWGIDRGALSLLLDREYPGNETELLGLLYAASSRATGELVTTRDLEEALTAAEPTLPLAVETVQGEQPRRRARPSPRSRRT